MKKAALIIENRNIKGLEKIIEKHMSFLPDFELIHLRPDYIKSRQSYNSFITSSTLWFNLYDVLEFDKVLIFQHDSEIFKPLDNEFLNYSYVGAPWKKGASWNTEDRRGGNGGLSIRDVKAHYELTRDKKYCPLKYINEDIYFSHLLDNVAPYDVCKKFSVETEFQLNTFGAHAIDKYLTKEQCNELRNFNI